MTASCVTNLLSDAPTTKDAFEGSHDRIAKAIADLIISEKTGKSVAVTGPWGSGKSSILHMLREKLEKTADVFIFDAWAHEGDPLRRTFLERLIDFLSLKYPKQNLGQLKNKILMRAKTQEVTTQPVLTWEAKILGFALLLVPAGVAVCSAAAKMANPTGTWFWVGMLMMLLPILILACLVLSAGLRAIVLAISPFSRKFAVAFAFGSLVTTTVWRWRWAISVVSSHMIPSLTAIVSMFAIFAAAKFRSTGKFSDVFPLLLNRTVTTTRSESIEPVDQSSVEFQKWFSEIIKLCGDDQKRPLVIAIDNLDRVDSSLALQLWSTMRTFVEFDFEINPMLGRVWLLATFDIDALRGLWQKDGIESRTVTDSFVNKTFQASFSVPL
jgi:energy-coupling factor transporter ATP-binding protein EcfA2